MHWDINFCLLIDCNLTMGSTAVLYLAPSIQKFTPAAILLYTAETASL